MATISIRLRDYAGRRAQLLAHVQDGESIADYQLGAQALLTQLDPVTACLIEDMVIEVPLAIQGGLKGAPIDNMEANRGGLLTFGTASKYAYGFWIPGIHDDVVDGENLLVDDTNMVGIRTWLITGSGGAFGDLVPHNGHGVDITNFVRGKLTFRKT